MHEGDDQNTFILEANTTALHYCNLYIYKPVEIIILSICQL